VARYAAPGWRDWDRDQPRRLRHAERRHRPAPGAARQPAGRRGPRMRGDAVREWGARRPPASSSCRAPA
jgi:hypothetical protein